MQKSAHCAIAGIGEQVWIFLLIGDVVVAVAGQIVDFVDRMACQTSQACLRLNFAAIDFCVHFAGEHEGRIVAGAAPLAFCLADIVPHFRKCSDMRIEPLIGFDGIFTHVIDGRFIKGIVER